MGLVSAAIGGVLIAAMLAVLAIRFLVDQVVVGIVLNLFALGVTGFLYERLMQPDAQKLQQAAADAELADPGLADIPVIGPVLFDTNMLVWLALILVVVIHFALSRTRWGLRTRAVGEHPTAADTVGIRVRGLRYTNVLLGGVIAGAGGAYFTLVATGSFNKNMTSGAGLHRAGRADLRPVDAVRGAGGGAVLRLRPEAGHVPERGRQPGAEPVPQHAAVHRDDHRGGRAGRPGPRAGRRRPALHQELAVFAKSSNTRSHSARRRDVVTGAANDA